MLRRIKKERTISRIPSNFFFLPIEIVKYFSLSIGFSTFGLDFFLRAIKELFYPFTSNLTTFPEKQGTAFIVFNLLQNLISSSNPLSSNSLPCSVSESIFNRFFPKALLRAILVFAVSESSRSFLLFNISEISLPAHTVSSREKELFLPAHKISISVSIRLRCSATAERFKKEQMKRFFENFALTTAFVPLVVNNIIDLFFTSLD